MHYEFIICKDNWNSLKYAIKSFKQRNLFYSSNWHYEDVTCCLVEIGVAN